MAENIFESYFDSNVLLLKLTSFWIYDDPKTTPLTKYSQLIYNLFFSTFMYFFYFPCEILFLYYVALGDLDLFLRSLRDMGNHIALIYKAINYFLLRKHILNLVDTLKYQDCVYEDCGEFRPGNIVRKHKNEALKWTTYFWSFVNTICLTMFVSGLVIFIIWGENQYIELENGEKAYRQKPPVNIFSPFGNKTRLQFIVTFFFTIFSLTYYAWMIVALDSLYITIMSCIGAHLEILEGAFMTLHQRSMLRLKLSHLDILHDSEELQKEVNQEMIRCVKHLQTILKVSEIFEAIYNVQTLFQTLCSLLEICFSLYLMSQGLDGNVGNEITYLIATAFELLMYCWFGNRITEASMNLSYSIYAGDWLSTDLNFRKSMILTLTRMKKPIYVTIGKVTPLTFNTFLTIVRGAYSFFTFLRQRDGIR